MDVESKEPLKVIKFDYLPEESPTRHGWALREGREEDLLSREDPAYGYVLWIKAEQDFCIDYRVGMLQQTCKAIGFVVRSESDFAFYAEIKVRSQQGVMPGSKLLYCHVIEGSYPEQHPEYPNEYEVHVPVEQLENGWVLMKIDLSQKAREAAAVRDEEWEFDRLLMLRLKVSRGEVDVARIDLYKENPFEPYPVHEEPSSDMGIPASMTLSSPLPSQEPVRKHRKRSHLIADSYADVTISFDFLLEQTEEPQDWAGIRLRGKKTSREGYFVIIRGDGRVEIVLVRPSSKDRIIRSYMLPHTSRTMHFAIAVVGTQISVELNGTEIMQGEADQYIDIGGVFLEVCRATATFSNLEIVPLVSDTIRRQVSPSGASPLAIPQQPPSVERPTPAIPVSPAIRRLANLIRALHEAGGPPCTLLLGSSLSLTPEVRRAACESDDWEAFWTFMEQLSNAERRAIMSRALSGLSLAPGYRCLTELARAGYFNIILTANVDDALDNALRILPASECQVLRHGQVSAQEIAAALYRIMPRVKAVKLRGDINSSILPLTLDGQFEFPKELEEAVERLLSQDTILVGDLPYDIDIQRCFKDEGALCIVVPEEPRLGSFLYRVKQKRPTGEIISGPEAEFVSFFSVLARQLGVEGSPVNDRARSALQPPISTVSEALASQRDASQIGDKLITVKGESVFPGFNLDVVRRQLNQMFDDAGLDAFCLDHFPDVYDKFSRGMRKDEKITLLLDHCRRASSRYQKLLSALEEQTE